MSAQRRTSVRGATFNLLPPGSVMCGWCDAYEAKAQKAAADAAETYAPALEALRDIARIPDHAKYCDREYSPCSKCQAQKVLRENGWAKRNRTKAVNP